jgi:CHAT domain-containing protein
MKIARTLSALLVIACYSAASSAQTEPAVSITPAQARERRVGLHETHVYEFSAGEGQIVRFDVVQTNVDPLLVISDADGSQLREMYFERVAGRTSISFIADGRTRFRLKLKPSGSSRVSGSYRLQMSTPRRSNELDRRRVEAEIALNAESFLAREAEKPAERITREQRRRRLNVLQRLVGEWRTLNELNFELETWRQIGLLAHRLQNAVLEQTAFEKARLLAQANEEEVAEAWALYHLADLAAQRGDHGTSERYLTTAAELATQSGAKTVEATIRHRLANRYQATEQYEKARGHLQKVIDIYTRLGSDVEAANARVSLAVISTKSDKSLDSTAIYMEALAVFEKNKAFYEKANVLRNLGAEAAAARQYEAADRHFREALALMEAHGKPEDAALVLYALGIANPNRSNEEARQYLEKALAKLVGVSDPETEVRVLLGLARLDLYKGDFTGVSAKAKKALGLADRAGMRFEQIVLNSLLSLLNTAFGNREAAAAYDREAKKLSDETPNNPLKETLANTSASVQQFMGDYPAAIKRYEESIKLAEARKQNDLIALGHLRLGGLYFELNDLARAGNAFKKATLYLAKSNNLTMKRALVLDNAQLDLRRDKLPEARAKLKGLLLELQRNNDVAVEAYAQQLLGEADLREKKYDEARAKFTLALTLQSKATPHAQAKSELPVLAALALRGLGDVSAARGETAEALDYYGQSLINFHLIDSPTGEAAVFENLMNAGRKSGNQRLAIFYGKQSVNLLQTVRRSIKPLDAGVRRSFLSSVESAYRTLAAALLEEGRIGEAQEVLSRLKEEEFHQFTRRSPDAVPGSLSPIASDNEEAEAARKYKELIDRIRNTAQQIDEFEIEGRIQPLTPEQLAKLQDLKSKLSVTSAAFLEVLKDLAADFGRAKTGGEPDATKTQAQLRQKQLAGLGRGTVLLTTLLTENRYYVIVTTPDAQVVHTKEISLDELTRQIQDLRYLLEEPSSTVLGDARAGGTTPLIRKIYQLLVKPIEADLSAANAATLLWSLDGVLRYVPFAVLHDGESYIVEKYTNLVVTLAQPPENMRASPFDWRVLGAGVSNPVDEEPLPHVELELRAIVRDEAAANRAAESNGLFVGRRLLNRQFSRNNFDLALRQRPQLVHLATHFTLNSGNDSNSFLTLGGREKLTLTEMRTEKLFDLDGVQLITLSACETMKNGAGVDGVEIESLGVIAQKRGARTVLASLWRIPDDGTHLLMTEFYRLYKNGSGNISKAEALRQAQLTLLKGNKLGHNYSHPAYWGAFIMLGNL